MRGDLLINAPLNANTVVALHFLNTLYCLLPLSPLSSFAYPQVTPNLRTSTFVMRQAAAQLAVPSPFAGVAGSPLSASGPDLTRQRPRSVSQLRPSRLASQRLPDSGGLASGRLASALPPAAESELEEPEPEFTLPRYARQYLKGIMSAHRRSV